MRTKLSKNRTETNLFGRINSIYKLFKKLRGGFKDIIAISIASSEAFEYVFPILTSYLNL